MIPPGPGNPPTESEQLFEQYLTAHGYTDWEHEPEIEGKRKKPDYRLAVAGSYFFFEVKEFDAPLPTLGYGSYDPYGPLREKINRAARQFKEFKAFACSVVMANPKYSFVDLDTPGIIIGSMLGNLGFEVQIGVPPGQQNSPKQVFTGGGKMVNYKRQKPQNTTISSIVILDHYPLRQMKIEIALDAWKRELGEPSLEEVWGFCDAFPKTPEDRVLRVAVYENPYARIPLRRDLFRGPFDGRWGVDGEVLRRVYVGDDLRRIEEQLERCDRRSPIQRLLDRQRDNVK